MPRSYSDGPDWGGDPPVQYRFAFPTITPMVRRLVIANLAIYGFLLLVYLARPEAHAFLTRWLGLDPLAWTRMFPFVPVWQLLTYGFLHAVGPWHVLFNMLLLYFFGTMVEGIVGSNRFLVAYVGALLAGAVLFLAFGLFRSDPLPAVGASGAVLGMVVAAACFRPDAQVILIVVPVPLKWLAVGIVALDMINGALGWRSGMSTGVAHLVHIGGALYGFLAVRKRFIWRDPIKSVQVRRAIAQEERRQSEERRMDELLEKIHSEGLNSLSKEEREFLKRVSERRSTASVGGPSKRPPP